jgi:two-component system NtrC family sensor kinase
MGCHANGTPRASIAPDSRARIFDDDDGTRVMGMILPVENAPECWNAACHAHPADRRVLGVIDANLSLARVDDQITAHRRQIVGFTGLAVLLFSSLSVAFVWAVVHRPVRELLGGTRRVAAGDLVHRIPVRSGDELGTLAGAFNAMVENLGVAQAENVAWARTLEERVARKTRELESAWAHLVASERMAALGKLAATVAHEVNNPLFGILTYARLLQKRLDAAAHGAPDAAARAEIEDGLRIIERESRRCGEIVRNLLTYARQAPGRREPQDANALVERALAIVRHQIALSGITLDERLAAGLPPLSCDAGQIQQVIVALLANAVDAMPRGGHLAVESAAAPDGGGLAITVRDDGVGIPPEVLPRIFEPFFTTKEGALRTGLGLAVAQSTVEQHGGSIAVRSAPGEGTEFVVRLPLEAASPAPVETPTETSRR